jgi:hypothetical protein
VQFHSVPVLSFVFFFQPEIVASRDSFQGQESYAPKENRAKGFGCGYFGTTANHQKNQTIRVIRPVNYGCLEPGYENNPGFLRSIGLGLGQFGLMPEDGLRELFETAEQRLELSILPGGSLI